MKKNDKTSATSRTKIYNEYSCNKIKAGSEMNEPKPNGNVLNETLQSDEHFADDDCKWQTEQKTSEKAESCWNRNTDLCVDVKTFLQKDKITQIGKRYPGVLTRDKDDHYQFVETISSTSGKRNPHVFMGEYINITMKDDGSLRPIFKPIKIDSNFTIDSYAIGVMNELRNALKGLVEEGGSK